MAKIRKEKFNVAGAHKKGRTTSHGQIELMLYYNTEGYNFYFDDKEMRPYFNIGDGERLMVDFRNCDTREKAIKTFQLLLDEQSTKTRMLRIKLRMPEYLFEVNNPRYKDSLKTTMQNFRLEQQKIVNTDLPDYLRVMLSGLYSNEFGLAVEFIRVMKIESNGHIMYSDCTSKWKYSPYSMNYQDENLIEWTEEREQFLIGMQEQMDIMCKKVLSFFNAKDINEFYQRMESGATKLLGTKE